MEDTLKNRFVEFWCKFLGYAKVPLLHTDTHELLKFIESEKQKSFEEGKKKILSIVKDRLVSCRVMYAYDKESYDPEDFDYNGPMVNNLISELEKGK